MGHAETGAPKAGDIVWFQFLVNVFFVYCLRKELRQENAPRSARNTEERMQHVQQREATTVLSQHITDVVPFRTYPSKNM
jgi:hypothetical protein